MSAAKDHQGGLPRGKAWDDGLDARASWTQVSARAQETLQAQDAEILDAVIAPLEKALTTNKVADLPLGVSWEQPKGS